MCKPRREGEGPITGVHQHVLTDAGQEAIAGADGLLIDETFGHETLSVTRQRLAAWVEHRPAGLPALRRWHLYRYLFALVDQALREAESRVCAELAEHFITGLVDGKTKPHAHYPRPMAVAELFGDPLATLVARAHDEGRDAAADWWDGTRYHEPSFQAINDAYALAARRPALTVSRTGEPSMLRKLPDYLHRGLREHDPADIDSVALHAAVQVRPHYEGWKHRSDRWIAHQARWLREGREGDLVDMARAFVDEDGLPYEVTSRLEIRDRALGRAVAAVVQGGTPTTIATADRSFSARLPKLTGLPVEIWEPIERIPHATPPSFQVFDMWDGRRKAKQGRHDVMDARCIQRLVYGVNDHGSNARLLLGTYKDQVGAVKAAARVAGWAAQCGLVQGERREPTDEEQAVAQKERPQLTETLTQLFRSRRLVEFGVVDGCSASGTNVYQGYNAVLAHTFVPNLGAVSAQAELLGLDEERLLADLQHETYRQLYGRLRGPFRPASERMFYGLIGAGRQVEAIVPALGDLLGVPAEVVNMPDGGVFTRTGSRAFKDLARAAMKQRGAVSRSMLDVLVRAADVDADGLSALLPRTTSETVDNKGCSISSGWNLDLFDALSEGAMCALPSPSTRAAIVADLAEEAGWTKHGRRRVWAESPAAAARLVALGEAARALLEVEPQAETIVAALADTHGAAVLVALDPRTVGMGLQGEPVVLPVPGRVALKVQTIPTDVIWTDRNIARRAHAYVLVNLAEYLQWVESHAVHVYANEAERSAVEARLRSVVDDAWARAHVDLARPPPPSPPQPRQRPPPPPGPVHVT